MTDEPEPRARWANGLSMLEAARRQALLSNVELWLRYLGLGGAARLAEMKRHLAGTRQLSRLEHNTLVHALNEHFQDVGRNRPIPYVNGE